MPLRPCLACGELTRSSYCPRHEPDRTSPGRGSGATAARFRREVLARTGGRCARCGSTDRVQAHHLVALAAGGGNDPPTNGEPLCHRCHRAVHRMQG